MTVRTDHGNALFYVLLGVVLFAALSFIITRQMGNDGLTGQLSEDKADIAAAQMIEHATAVKFAIQQMLDNGSTIDQIDFVMPGEAGYDTAPHMHKVFHPGGGGITPMTVRTEYFNTPTGGNRGWRYMKGQNVEWTPTTQSDLIYSFIDISEAICRKINKKITGSETYPTFVTDSMKNVMDYAQTPNKDFLISNCPTCNGRYSYCAQGPGGTNFGFYTIVAAR